MLGPHSHYFILFYIILYYVILFYGAFVHHVWCNVRKLSLNMSWYMFASWCIAERRCNLEREKHLNWWSASWTKRLKVSTQWMRSVMNAECHRYQYTHFKLYNKLCLQTMNRIVWCLKRVYTYHHANSRNRLDVRCERTMSFFTGYMTKHQKRHCCPRNNDEQTRVRQVSNREHGN